MNRRASLLVVALSALLLAGCHPFARVDASAQIGRDGAAGVGQVLADQRLVDYFGSEEAAITELKLQGVPEKTARKRITDAQVARGAKKETKS